MKNQTTLCAVLVSAVMSVAAPALAHTDASQAPTPQCGGDKAANEKKAQPDASKGEKSVKGDKKDNEQKDTAKPSVGAA